VFKRNALANLNKSTIDTESQITLETPKKARKTISQIRPSDYMALKKFEPQREPLMKKSTGDYDQRLPYNTNAYDTELSYDKFDTAKTELINPKNTKPLRPDDTTIDDH